MSEDISAIILAGGEGSRLQNILQGRQKVLFSLHNKPLIQYTIESLPRDIVKKIILATGKNYEEVAEWINNNPHITPNTLLSTPNERGVASAFLEALKLTDSKTVILCNGDEIRMGLDIHKALAFHEAQNAIATMVAAKTNKLYRHRVLEIDDQKILLNSQLKNPKYNADPTIIGWVNAGLVIAERDILLNVLSDDSQGWDNIINELTRTDRLYVFQYDSLRYFNVGTEEEFNEADLFLKSQQ